MMEENSPLLEALTRANFQRESLLVDTKLHLTNLSDQALIHYLSNKELFPRREILLMHLSELLRLMDKLDINEVAGEEFVEKFTNKWLSIQEWETDSESESIFDEINDFYSDIQMFTNSVEERKKEPLLFGIERLKLITKEEYKSLKKKWQSLILSEDSSN